MTTTTERGDPPRRPSRQTKITPAGRPLVIGVTVGLLIGAVSGLAIGRVTVDRSEINAGRSEIERLTAEAADQMAEATRLSAEAGERADEVAALTTQLGERDEDLDELSAEVTGLNSQVETLEADKVTLQERLDQFLNPPVGPNPTAKLSARSVGRWESYEHEVVVCVGVENTSAADLDVYYSYSQFTAIDAKGLVYPSRLPTPGYRLQLAARIGEGLLGSGDKRVGEVLFDVPTDSRLTRLVWRTGFADTPEITIDLPQTGEYRGGRC